MPQLRAIQFRSAPQFPAGSLPRSLAVADFTRDGRSDVAVVNPDEDLVTVLFSHRGKNALAAGSSVPTGNHPVAVVAGNFDPNNSPDLAVANRDDGTVSIFLNIGKGEFGEAASVFLDGEPSALLLYGTQIAVADRANARILLLANDGRGFFAISQEFEVGGQPIALATGDIDNDGLLDLVSANFADASLSVLRATEGGFEPAERVRLDSPPGAVAVGDLNGDGFADLVATLPLIDEVVVFAAKERGGFERPLPISVPVIPSAVAIADEDTILLTGDDLPDLAILSQGTSTLSVFKGVPDPTNKGLPNFKLVAHFITGRAPVAMAAGQIDGDAAGFADWVVANSGDDSVSLLTGRRQASLIAAVSFDAGSAVSDVASADFDGDGNLDALTANTGEDTIAFLRGNGRGSLRRPVLSLVQRSPNLVAAADFTGDGLPDAVVGSTEVPSVRLLKGMGTGEFGPDREVRLPAAPLGSVAVPVALDAGDMNGNVTADLVVADAANSAVHVFFDPSRGTRQPLSLASFFVPADTIIADLDGDGLAEVAATAPDGNRVVVWFQGPLGVFAPARSFAAGERPARLVAAQLNGDNLMDIVTANPVEQTVNILLGKTDGFAEPEPLPLAGHPVAVAAADFNFDNFTDVAVVDDASDVVVVFAGDGTGRLFKAGTFASGLAPTAVVAGLFRGTRLPDLVIAAPAANQVTMLRNTSNSGLPPLPTPTATPPPAQGGSSGCNLAGGGGMGVVLSVLLAALLLCLPSSAAYRDTSPRQRSGPPWPGRWHKRS